jgi:uncharacterized protein YjbJ (UPF0337 family)
MPHEKEKAKGKLEQIEGKGREELGKLGGDTSTQVGGLVEQGRGKVRETVADVRGKVEHRDRDVERDKDVEP